MNGLREMIYDFWRPEVDGIDLGNFPQDDTTCHTRNEAIDHLREKFPERVTSRRGDRKWQPRTWD